MTLYADLGDVVIHHADARTAWQDLPAGSVHAIVTSPPYYGLRDYGTGTWQGGRDDCDHGEAEKQAKRAFSRESSTLDSAHPTSGGAVVRKRVCSACSAIYEDGQLGLEDTPDAYIDGLADLLTAWGTSVLRPDGSLWLNLGDSMAAEDTVSRPRCLGAPPYGTAGTALQGSTGGGSSSSSLCDGCRASAPTPPHSARTGTLPARGSDPCADVPTPARSRSPHPVPDSAGSTGPSPTELSGRATPDPALAAIPADAPPPASPASTPDGSPQPPPGVCSHCGTCGACLAVLGSSPRDARLCARRAGSTRDTSVHPRPLAVRTPGTEPSSSAWGDSTITFRRKSALMIPERVALALIARGWILRNKIVWAKPNGMPSSVTDRLATKWEYLFHLVRRPRYFYDLDAVREPHVDPTRTAPPSPRGSTRWSASAHVGQPQQGSGRDGVGQHESGVNPGDVWTIATQPYPDAHFAVFPPELVRRPILATVPEGGTVADPFFGSGTTGVMVRRLGRRCVGVELNEAYCALAADRFRQTVLEWETA